MNSLPIDVVLTRTTPGWKDGTGVQTSLPEGCYRITGQRIDRGTRYLLLDGEVWVSYWDVSVVAVGVATGNSNLGSA